MYMYTNPVSRLSKQTVIYRHQKVIPEMPGDLKFQSTETESETELKKKLFTVRLTVREGVSPLGPDHKQM